MVEAVLDGLRVSEKENARYIDGTVGAGGHSTAILAARPDNQLMGLDKDGSALALAAENLAPFEERVKLVQQSYLRMREAAQEWLADESPLVDGILLDLGLSSMQLDRAERGFAFRFAGPLDMRFDPDRGELTAGEIVNHWAEEEIANILYRYGEEKNSRRIARAIVETRPLNDTVELARVIESAQRGPREKIHPATRSFQALRIAVNDELAVLEAALPKAIDLLKPGGRLAVIAFHSLEDRIVKHYFKQEATGCICPPQQPICTCEHQARIELVTRKPLTADEAEVAQNPRARSAKLRIIERI
jgi:16S rRNA (cytosine1402-N4)-methyltransferase